MWYKLLQFALTFLLNRLIEYVKEEYADAQEDQAKREEINLKVKAVKDARTKEELRTAIANLSF